MDNDTTGHAVTEGNSLIDESWSAAELLGGCRNDAGGSALSLRALSAWRAFGLRGADAAEDAAQLGREADAVNDTGVMIEALALQALTALAAGEDARAVQMARQASRLAAGCANANAFVVANLTLARVRRHLGRPYLALRILSGLAPTLTPAWRAWFGWEWRLAGGLDDAGGEVGAAVMALSDLLRTATAGDRAGVNAASAQLEAVLKNAVPFAQEAADLAALIDLERDASEAVRAFRDGSVAKTPAGLHGVCAHGGSPVEALRVNAFVIAAPHARARRCLRVGLPLLQLEGDAEAPPAMLEPAQARVTTGIAVLALGPVEGMSVSAFFRAVYGFSFAGDVHRGVLDVLIHRMRKTVGALGEITREAGVMTLRLARPTVLPDPRCVQPVEERVLAFLVGTGPVTNEQTAAALALPVRTVQALMHQLVEDGACRVLRDGRHVRYAVEDTTFSAPAA